MFFIVMTELELKTKMITYFSEWFDVQKECYTNTNNERGFIDILMWHRTDKNKEYPVGIEVKLPGKKTGEQIGRWLAQSNRYHNSEFNGHKPIVIIYPQISGLYFEEGLNVAKHDVFSRSIQTKDYTISQPTQHNWNTCQYNIFKTGELQKYFVKQQLTGLRMVCNSKHLWDNENPTSFNYTNYKYLKQLP